MEMRFSDDFLKALEFSRDEAVRTGWHNICPDHIMLGILRLASPETEEILHLAGVDPALFKSRIDEALFVDEAIGWEERDSILPCDSARSFLEHAGLEARRCGATAVTPFHFILAACRINGPFCHDYLEECGISLRSLVEASGMDWKDYGLRAEGFTAMQTPDPALMAEAIERRIKEGYTTAADVPAS